MVGGAPLNEEFGRAIGADAYCRDAAVAVETAKDFMARKHNQLRAVGLKPWPPRSACSGPVTDALLLAADGRLRQHRPIRGSSTAFLADPRHHIAGAIGGWAGWSASPRRSTTFIPTSPSSSGSTSSASSKAALRRGSPRGSMRALLRSRPARSAAPRPGCSPTAAPAPSRFYESLGGERDGEDRAMFSFALARGGRAMTTCSATPR